MHISKYGVFRYLLGFKIQVSLGRIKIFQSFQRERELFPEGKSKKQNYTIIVYLFLYIMKTSPLKGYRHNISIPLARLKRRKT